MTSIAAQNMTDRAYEAIKDRIVTLQLRPGQRITEERISELLDSPVSKTPARDALRWLVRDGFVDKVGRGYRVTPITIRVTRDLYMFRAVLETAAVRRLLARPRNIDQLVEHQSSAAAAYDPSDPESIRRYLCDSDRFHVTLARLAGSPILTQSLTLTLERLQPALHLMLRTVPQAWLTACEHNELAAAIASGDCDRAVQAMQEHLHTAEQLVLDLLINLDGEVQVPTDPAVATPVGGPTG